MGDGIGSSIGGSIGGSISRGSKLMGKTFQAAQLTHERFLTIDHSRGPWKFSLADTYQKNILPE